MEKRISYQQFQSVKNVAKAIEPILRKMKALEENIQALQEEIAGNKAMADALEEGIVKMTGCHANELVKKAVEVTGTTAEGKPIKSTKFLPTDIVTYDKVKKQYIITLPDAEEQKEEEKAEEPLRVPAESAYGNDYDIDKEKIQKEADHGDFLNPTGMDIFD